MEQLILGIDIGSSKICSLIADLRDGKPHIIGVGIQSARGIKKGMIVDLAQATKCIRDSVNDAKRVAGAEIQKAYVSLSGAYTCDNEALVSFSGAHTKSMDGYGVISEVNKRIGINEINRVINNALFAMKQNMPPNYVILHVLPYTFKLDGAEVEPFDLTGTKLEVFVRVILAHKSGLENLKRAVNGAGVEISGIVSSAYASAIAVLSDDEKKHGAVCIDIGASSCDIMIYQGNSLRYDGFVGVGSATITNDIAECVKISSVTAENIKKEFAKLSELTQEEQESCVEVESNKETKEIEFSVLHGIVVSRVAEIMKIIEEFLEESKLKSNIHGGIIFTGGMVSMPNLAEYARNIFDNMPVRVALPQDINMSFEQLKDPAYSTAVGLILYGAGKFTNYEHVSNYERSFGDKQDLRTNLETKMLVDNKLVRPTQSSDDAINPIDIGNDEIFKENKPAKITIRQSGEKSKTNWFNEYVVTPIRKMF